MSLQDLIKKEEVSKTLDLTVENINLGTSLAKENLIKDGIRLKDCTIGGFYIGFTVFEEVLRYMDNIGDQRKSASSAYEAWNSEIESSNSNLRKIGAKTLLKHTPEKDDDLLEEIYTRRTPYMVSAIVGMTLSPLHIIGHTIKKNYDELKNKK